MDMCLNSYELLYFFYHGKEIEPWLGLYPPQAHVSMSPRCFSVLLFPLLLLLPYCPPLYNFLLSSLRNVSLFIFVLSFWISWFLLHLANWRSNFGDFSIPSIGFRIWPENRFFVQIWAILVSSLR